MEASVITPPAQLELHPFYKKYLDAGGIPIISSDKVPDAALFKARAIIDEILIYRPDIRAKLAEDGNKVTIAGDSEVATDIPELTDYFERYPNNREPTSGTAMYHVKMTYIKSRNILCTKGDAHPNEDILVHEFAHTIHVMALKRMDGGDAFQMRLGMAYRDSLDAGLWERTYASTNRNEYWAEGVQSWFNLNDPPRSNHNNINTRAELLSYDPVLAALILEVFGDAEVTSSCHKTIDINYDFTIKGVIKGPDGRPLEDVFLWAGQTTRLDSGTDRTDAEGMFRIRVPEGAFRLDITVGDPPRCAWYNGDGGVTSIRADAARVEVTGANVEGMEITFHKPPNDLPITRC